jgi:hypothetical protein
MDAVSAAANVIALIQISGQVFDLCQSYYLGVKNAREDSCRLRNEVMSLQDVLTNVSVGITTLSDTSLVEQVGTNCTRHPICEGACMLLMVTSDSLNLGGGKAVLIYMSPE